MTWGEFKAMVERRGVSDDHEVVPRHVLETARRTVTTGPATFSAMSLSFPGTIIPPEIDVIVHEPEPGIGRGGAVVIQFRQPSLP